MSRDRFAEEAERIGRKARRLLNDVGWEASRAELAEELDNTESFSFDAEDRGSILARAEGLQRERRLQKESNARRAATPEAAISVENLLHTTDATEEPMSAATEQSIDREAIREFLRE